LHSYQSRLSFVFVYYYISVSESDKCGIAYISFDMINSVWIMRILIRILLLNIFVTILSN